MSSKGCSISTDVYLPAECAYDIKAHMHINAKGERNGWIRITSSMNCITFLFESEQDMMDFIDLWGVVDITVDTERRPA